MIHHIATSVLQKDMEMRDALLTKIIKAKHLTAEDLRDMTVTRSGSLDRTVETYRLHGLLIMEVYITCVGDAAQFKYMVPKFVTKEDL